MMVQISYYTLKMMKQSLHGHKANKKKTEKKTMNKLGSQKKITNKLFVWLFIFPIFLVISLLLFFTFFLFDGLLFIAFVFSECTSLLSLHFFFFAFYYFSKKLIGKWKPTWAHFPSNFLNVCVLVFLSAYFHK